MLPASYESTNPCVQHKSGFDTAKAVVRCSLAVRILDSHSSDPSSNLGIGTFLENFRKKLFLKNATAVGFEPTRAKPIGFQVQLLNRSDTMSFV